MRAAAADAPTTSSEARKLRDGPRVSLERRCRGGPQITAALRASQPTQLGVSNVQSCSGGIVKLWNDTSPPRGCARHAPVGHMVKTTNTRAEVLAANWTSRPWTKAARQGTGTVRVESVQTKASQPWDYTPATNAKKFAVKGIKPWPKNISAGSWRKRPPQEEVCLSYCSMQALWMRSGNGDETLDQRFPRAGEAKPQRFPPSERLRRGHWKISETRTKKYLTCCDGQEHVAKPRTPAGGLQKSAKGKRGMT